jgi:hypothetical protein
MLRMRVACWITKATDTHSEYVIPIAFPRQLYLRESASILHYTYIASLVFTRVINFLVGKTFLMIIFWSFKNVDMLVFMLLCFEVFFIAVSS